MRRRSSLFILGALLLMILGGCGPEDGRARSGGFGADVGNHARGEIPKSKVFNTGADGSESGNEPKEEQPQP